MSYYEKYLKYKNKYLKLSNKQKNSNIQQGGAIIFRNNENINDITTMASLIGLRANKFSSLIIEKDINLKFFFIRLASITLAIIIIISFIYNTIFAEKIDTFMQILQLSKKENRALVVSKIRSELNKAISKDEILYKEDAILLQKLFYKIKKEVDEAQ